MEVQCPLLYVVDCSHEPDLLVFGLHHQLLTEFPICLLDFLNAKDEDEQEDSHERHFHENHNQGADDGGDVIPQNIGAEGELVIYGDLVRSAQAN